MIVTLHDIPETLWQRWCMLCQQENSNASEVTEKLLIYSMDYHSKTGKFMPLKNTREDNVVRIRK